MSDMNPLLAGLKLPGRIFQLPSKGIFYKNDELDNTVTDGEIHVHAMSAFDEIIMKNPDQLFSGKAINTVVSRCVSGVVRPTDLLAKDVDALMLFLRTVTYGSSYEFMAKHSCENAKDHSYIADIDVIISKMNMIDESRLDEMYKVVLQNGQTVKLKPHKYGQILEIINRNQSKKEITSEDQKKNLIDMMLGVIESVDDTIDPNLIAEWILEIPAPFANRIATKIEKLNDWGADLTWECVCKDCGEKFEIEIPINSVSFFTE